MVDHIKKSHPEEDLGAITHFKWQHKEGGTYSKPNPRARKTPHVPPSTKDMPCPDWDMVEKLVRDFDKPSRWSPQTNIYFFIENIAHSNIKTDQNTQ
jgi:hypothetical protein